MKAYPVLLFAIFQSLLNAIHGGHERPVDSMADLTNDLGVSVLQILAASKHNNIAFSPYGLTSISMLLFEGANGHTALEILKVLNLPWNNLYARFGFRDLNRHIKTYFKSDGFLQGLIMSRDKVCFHYSYQKLLRFYGFEEPDTALTYPCDGFTPYSTTTTSATTTSRIETTSSITVPDTGSKSTNPSMTGPAVNTPTTSAMTSPDSPKSTEPSVTDPDISTLTTPDEPTGAQSEGSIVTEQTQTSQTILVVDPMKRVNLAETGKIFPFTEDDTIAAASTVVEKGIIDTQSSINAEQLTPDTQSSINAERLTPDTESSINVEQLTPSNTNIVSQILEPSGKNINVSDVINTIASVIQKTENSNLDMGSSPIYSPDETHKRFIFSTQSTIDPNIASPLEIPKFETTTFKPGPSSATNSIPLTLPAYDKDTIMEKYGPLPISDVAKLVSLSSRSAHDDVKKVSDNSNSLDEQKREYPQDKDNPNRRIGRHFKRKFYSRKSNKTNVNGGNINHHHRLHPIFDKKAPFGIGVTNVGESSSSAFSFEDFDEKFESFWNSSFPDFSESGFDFNSTNNGTEDDFFSDFGFDDDDWDIFKNSTFSHDWKSHDEEWGFRKHGSNNTDDKWGFKNKFFPKSDKTPKTDETPKPDIEELEPSENPPEVSDNDPSRISLFPARNITNQTSLFFKRSRPEKIKNLDENPFSVSSTSVNSVFSSIRNIKPMFDSTTDAIQTFFQSIIPYLSAEETNIVEKVDLNQNSSLQKLSDKNFTNYGTSENFNYSSTKSNSTKPKNYFDVISLKQSNIVSTKVTINDGKTKNNASKQNLKFNNLKNCNISDTTNNLCSKIKARILKQNPKISNYSVSNGQNALENFNEDTQNPTANNLLRKKRSFGHSYSKKFDDHLPFFDAWETNTLWFSTFSHHKILVPTFTYSALLPFAFMPDLNTQALQVPLDDPRYLLLILLPLHRLGLDSLLNALSYYPIRRIYSRLRPTSIYAVIPALHMVSHVDLKPVLYQLGMRNIFHRYTADLSQMSPDDRLYVRGIEQVITISITKYPQAVYEVPKILTEAHFIASHPFAYFVLDKETKVSLVAGIMGDPSKQETFAFI